MDKRRTNLKLFKLTKILILIIIIPALVLGIFSGVMIFTSKANGGFPSLFGVASLQVNNDKFYDNLQEKYAKGDYFGFSAKQSTQYAKGDFVAFYVGQIAENPTEITSTEPYPFEAARTMAKINKISVFNSNVGSVAGNMFADGENVIKIPPLTNEEKTYNNGAEVKFGIITDRYRGFDAQGASYICFTIFDCSETYDPNRTDVNNYILAKTIIGAETNTSPAVLGFMNFAASMLGFVILILIPCALMVVFYVINITSKTAFEKEEKEVKKKLIRSQELKEQNEMAGKRVIVNQFESDTDLARKIEEFDKPKSAEQKKAAKLSKKEKLQFERGLEQSAQDELDENEEQIEENTADLKPQNNFRANASVGTGVSGNVSGNTFVGAQNTSENAQNMGPVNAKIVPPNVPSFKGGNGAVENNTASGSDSTTNANVFVAGVNPKAPPPPPKAPPIRPSGQTANSNLAANQQTTLNNPQNISNAGKTVGNSATNPGVSAPAQPATSSKLNAEAQNLSPKSTPLAGNSQVGVPSSQTQAKTNAANVPPAPPKPPKAPPRS